MKDWRFLAASLFLWILFPVYVGAQYWTDTIRPEDTLKKPSWSVFLNESIVAGIDTLREADIPAFFRPHALAVHNDQAKMRKFKRTDWAVLILFTCFVLLAWMQYYYRKRLDQYFRAFLTGRYFNQLTRSGDVYTERITVNLFFIYTLVVPLLLFEVNTHLNLVPIPDMAFGNMILYLIFLACFLVLYGLKIFALQLAGIVFKTQSLTAEYILTHFIFNLIEGLIMLPLMLVLLVTASTLILKSTLVLLAAITFYRLFRGFFIGLRESRYSVFYMLIFFFSMEIMPMMVLWKILLKNYPM